MRLLSFPKLRSNDKQINLLFLGHKPLSEVLEFLWEYTYAHACVCRWVMAVIIEAAKLERAYGSAMIIEGPSHYLPAVRVTYTNTHIQDPDNDIGYLQYVCECILYVCEGQTAPPFTSWQMTQPSRCNWHTRSHTNGLQVCLSCYQKVWQVETDKMDGWIEEKQSERVAEEHRIWRALSTLKSKVKLKSKDKTYSVHWVCEYLYILRWYRSHQNILLVDTSTSRATAFFRVGTTCTYSFFSRSMRRISWRLVNIRYGLFPDGEVKDVHAMIMYKHIPKDHIPQFMYDLTLKRLDREATKVRRWVVTLDWY